MTDRTDTPHRVAALSLLQHRPGLSHKEAGFLGNVCVAAVLSERQLDWLTRLLHRHGMPSLDAGGSQ